MTTLLETHLEPIVPYLKDPEIGDICINRPGEIFVYRFGVGQQYMEAVEVPELTMQHLIDTAGLIAVHSHGQQFSVDNPNISADLETGERVEILGFNTVKQGAFGIAIRKPPKEVRAEDLVSLGLFDRDKAKAYLEEHGDTHAIREDLCSRSKDLHPLAILELFIKEGCNILFSGPTGVYKTTLARWVLSCLDWNMRIGSIEDAIELISMHPNRLYIVASRSEHKFNFADALRSTLRLYFDAILVGELRGSEAAQLYEVMASGHRPTVSTTHALNPSHAIRKVSRLSGVAATDLEDEIDLIVQMVKHKGDKFVSEMICPGFDCLYP